MLVASSSALVLNVALGGTLYQDVGTDPGTEIQHSQKEARDQTTHKVTVTPGSRLAKILGADDVEANSFHHQVIKALGRGLTAVAWAPGFSPSSSAASRDISETMR